MSTRLIHRPARLHRTIQPDDPVKIASVPTVRHSNSQMGGILRVLMPLVAGLGMVLMMFSTGNPIRMAIGSVMLVMVLITSVGMYIRSKTGARKQAEDQRERFLEHLEEEEKKIFTAARKQRRWSEARNPAPLALLDVMNQPHRLWERRPSDEDFLIVRLGVGTGELACGIDVRPASDPMLVPEPIAQAHLDRMVKRCSTIDDLPIAVPLQGVVSIVGEPEATTNVLRALLVQVAALHAPDDVRFHVALPLCANTESMQWALWLPHLLHGHHFDGPIASRNVSRDPDTAHLLYQEIYERQEELQASGRAQAIPVQRPHLLVVVDSATQHGKELLNAVTACNDMVAARITLLVVSTKQREEPSHVDVRISINAERIDAPTFKVELLDRGIIGPPAQGQAGFPQRMMYGGCQGRVDTVSTNLAEAIARKLSPLRLIPDAEPDAPLERTIALDRLLGIADFHTYNVAEQWAPRPPEEFLHVPIGVDAEGLPIRLDIKESALNGMGPHGLCVGATGSGKSEVLRTLVLAQAICHPPDLLSFVLVDYKGGATFAGCEALPHTAAIVDNLEDAAGLVDRLHDAIYGEIQRRQRVLQAGGNLANIWEYNKLRAQGALDEPLPHLFVVIDEFGELLAAKPEFIDLFVQIGRIGRSIGVHLLLASQRLEEGRLRGLESYLSYRIGLRTFSAQESRAAIGCADAHELPAIPGSGLLKVDPDMFERFKAAYVSGIYQPAQRHVQRELPPMPMPLELHNTTEAWLSGRQEAYNLDLA
ncbi:MAG: type VII secretion protein EccCa, partial [Corynebacterium sp.]|nr:type VII secretion protein EccCa [Corynebacterium sp.]